MATDKEILIRARELIADPEHWTRCSLALAAWGDPVAPNSPDACRRCLLGAVQAALHELRPGWTPDDQHAVLRPLRAAIRERTGHDWDSVTDFNDRFNHIAVQWVLDGAIRQCVC